MAEQPTKICIECEKVLPVENFSKGKNQCKPCKKIIQKKSLNEKVAKGETKKCLQCKEVKPINKFHGTKCSSCNEKNKVSRTKETIKNETDGGRQVALNKGNHPINCTGCGKLFTIENCNEFKYDIGKNAYKTECKECTNKHEYSKTHRKKMRDKDLIGFLFRNARVAKNYRKLHPEITENRNKERKVNSTIKIKEIIASAKTRNIFFDNDDIELLKEKLELSCTYCGYLHIDELNGIDRLDNKIGYTDDNTVPCCNICNIIKQEYNLEDFYKQVDYIVDNNEDFVCSEKDKFYLPHSNFGFGETLGLRAGKKENKLTNEEENRIKTQICIYCKTNQGTTIDRIDSSKCYTMDNCVSSCSMCNYMKKDMTHEDFIRHIRRINLYLENKIYDDKNTVVETVIESVVEQVVQTNPKKKIEVVPTVNEKLEVVKAKRIQHFASERHIQVILRDSEGRIVAKRPTLKSMGDVLHHSNLTTFVKDQGNIVRGYKIEEIETSEYDNYIVDEEAAKIALEDLSKHKSKPNKKQNKYTIVIENKKYNSATEASVILDCSEGTVRSHIKKSIDAGINNCEINNKKFIFTIS